MTGGEVYEFGAFTLDPAERRLSHEGRPVALPPKTLEVLVALVLNAGRLVTKRELLELVWPESFVEEGILAVHISTLRKSLGGANDGRRYIETVSRSGYRFIDAVVPRRTGWSIAVLPATGGDRAAGLAIADALIDRLGSLAHIVVRPTRAVHSYTDAGQDPAGIGRALRVDVVLDSRLQAVPERIRISAQLIRSRDGDRLWHGEFEEQAVRLAALRDAVAESVATYLGSRLDPASNASRPAAHAEIYELFGRGRAHLLTASHWEMPKAVEAFRAAIELDPTYAAAHAGLALAYCAQAELRVAPHAEAYAEAKASALRALAMDDSCADAQVALGAVLFLSEWNWVGAKRSFQRALEINPNHTEAYLLYGRLLEAQGRLAAGLETKLKALERDPFSSLVHLQIALSYWNQRRYDDSIEWANKALELDPRHLLAREHIAAGYWKKGDFDRQMAESVKHAESFGAPPELVAELMRIYAEGGRRGVVLYTIQRLSGNESGAADIQLAVMNGELGNRDAAFRHLERAIASHDPSLVHLAVAPQWDSLRADPRFSECLARMGLGGV